MRQTHALIIVIMMLAAGLACTLSDNTNANSEVLNRPTSFVFPTATITPTPEADNDDDEENDNSSNNGSNSGNSGQNSGNSGNNGNSGNSGNSSGGVIVGCNPRTDWVV